mmetsp:Transcript_41896/g.80159  ORF Transcript_41896/g.80159 Transcript_41896/m.80159 type:complete len:350 (-) Transcript_41896:282-1331(-)
MMIGAGLDSGRDVYTSSSEEDSDEDLSSTDEDAAEPLSSSSNNNNYRNNSSSNNKDHNSVEDCAPAPALALDPSPPSASSAMRSHPDGLRHAAGHGGAPWATMGHAETSAALDASLVAKAVGAGDFALVSHRRTYSDSQQSRSGVGSAVGDMRVETTLPSPIPTARGGEGAGGASGTSPSPHAAASKASLAPSHVRTKSETSDTPSTVRPSASVTSATPDAGTQIGTARWMGFPGETPECATSPSRWSRTSGHTQSRQARESVDIQSRITLYDLSGNVISRGSSRSSSTSTLFELEESSVAVPSGNHVPSIQAPPVLQTGSNANCREVMWNSNIFYDDESLRSLREINS